MSRKKEPKIVESTFWNNEKELNKTFLSESVVSYDESLASPIPNSTAWEEKNEFEQKLHFKKHTKGRTVKAAIKQTARNQVASAPVPQATESLISENSEAMVKKQILENFIDATSGRVLKTVGGTWSVIAVTALIITVIGFITPTQQTGYKCLYPVTTTTTTTTTTTRTTTTGTTTTTLSCPSLTYFNVTSGRCEPQKLYLDQCSALMHCRTDLGLSCLSGHCYCLNLNQFWDTGSTICKNKYTYNSGPCTNSTHCASNLICNTGSTACKCPSAVSAGNCDCPNRVNGSEYYWDGSACVPALDYGKPCSADYACKTIEQNTLCISGVCACDASKTFFNNRCRGCKNSWILRNSTGVCYYWSIVQLTPNGLATSSEIQTACDNEPTAKLAIIDSTEIRDILLQVFSSKDAYYVDGMRTVGDTFKSKDGSWTLDPSMWCKSPRVGDNCLYYQHCAASTNPLLFCFESAGCTSSRFGICEYPSN